MALPKDFPKDPYTILDPGIRWFPADEALRETSMEKLMPPLVAVLRQKVKELADAGTKHMILNFSSVPYIDSTGIGFLVGSRVTAENMGMNMVLAGINPHVKKILDSVRLSSFFVMADDESSALSKVKEIGSGKSGESARPAKGKKGASEAPGPETVPSE